MAYNVRLTEINVRKYGNEVSDVNELKNKIDRTGIRRLGNIYCGGGKHYPNWTTLYYVDINKIYEKILTLGIEE